MSPRRARRCAWPAAILLLALVAGWGVAPASAGPEGEFGVSVTARAATPIDVRITEVKPSTGLVVGDRFQVTATVANTGAQPLRLTRSTLNADGSGLDIRGNPTERAGTIPPGGKRQETWNVLARQPGDYAVSVSTTSHLDMPRGIEVTSESRAVMVHVGAPSVAATPAPTPTRTPTPTPTSTPTSTPAATSTPIPAGPASSPPRR